MKGKKMKKILSLFAVLIFFVTTARAATTTDWDSEASLKRVNTIGSKLLKANGLPTQVVFKVSDDESINAYANLEKEVYVFKGLLQYVETDDELAGVIGHELSHISLNHIIKGAYKNAVVSSLLYGLTTSTNKTVAASADAAKSLTSLKLSRNDEYEADMTGADLMVNAGYNPLGEISVLNKICEKSVDFLSDHPSGDKRVVALYNYITYNYPQFYNTSYPTSSYASFRSYMGPKVMERKASEKLTKKYEKEQAKLKKKHVKNLEKMKKGTFGWDASYAILNSLTTQQSSDASNAQ